MRDTIDFYVETQIGKNLRGGGEEFTIIRRLHELQELYAKLLVVSLIGSKRIKKSSPSLKENVYLYLIWSACMRVNNTGVILVNAWFARVDLL